MIDGLYICLSPKALWIEWLYLVFLGIGRDDVCGSGISLSCLLFIQGVGVV